MALEFNMKYQTLHSPGTPIHSRKSSAITPKIPTNRSTWQSAMFCPSSSPGGARNNVDNSATPPIEEVRSTSKNPQEPYPMKISKMTTVVSPKQTRNPKTMQSVVPHAKRQLPTPDVSEWIHSALDIYHSHLNGDLPVGRLLSAPMSVCFRYPMLL